MTRLWKVLALLALLLMPFGMASAPAVASPVPAPAAGMEHCADQQAPVDEPAKPPVHCTGCSALPALDTPVEVARLVLRAPRLLARTHAITGIEPEIATPPPKAA